MIVEVIKGLFINIAIGKYILKKHNKMILKFNEPGDELIIGAVEYNNHFTYIDVLLPPLFFHHFINITPIVMSS